MRYPYTSDDHTSMSTAIDSVTETGPSTGKDVTRPITNVMALMDHAAAEALKVGPRPAARNPSLRRDELGRPSVTLQPGNVEAIEGYDDETKGYVEDALTTFNTMHQTVEKIIEMREASKSDPTMNEAAQVIAVADAADRLTAATTKAIDNTLAALQKRIAHVEGELRKPMDGTLVTPVAVEVRQYARELSAPKRNELVMGLIEKGDAKTLGALLTAPAFLSGLSDAQITAYTEMHNRKANPLLTKRLAVMKAAHQKLSDAGSLFIVQSERAQGVQPSVVAKLKAAKAKAAAAFR